LRITFASLVDTTLLLRFSDVANEPEHIALVEKLDAAAATTEMIRNFICRRMMQ
jgi:hypothetical protein